MYGVDDQSMYPDVGVRWQTFQHHGSNENELTTYAGFRGQFILKGLNFFHFFS
jgi:hypothetical protein